MYASTAQGPSYRSRRLAERAVARAVTVAASSWAEGDPRRDQAIERVYARRKELTELVGAEFAVELLAAGELWRRRRDLVRVTLPCLAMMVTALAVMVTLGWLLIPISAMAWTGVWWIIHERKADLVLSTHAHPAGLVAAHPALARTVAAHWRSLPASTLAVVHLGTRLRGLLDRGVLAHDKVQRELFHVVAETAESSLGEVFDVSVAALATPEV